MADMEIIDSRFRDAYWGDIGTMDNRQSIVDRRRDKEKKPADEENETENETKNET